MSVKFALLGILAEKERHGYELKDVFDQRVGEFWALNFGQIYSTLDRLEARGFVEWRSEPQERRPNRKIYRITADGRRELEAWLTRPVTRPRALRDELFIKLLLLDERDPAPLLELIRRQKQVYLSHMQRLTKRKLALDRRRDVVVTELLMDAALFHAAADLRWLEHTEKKLRSRAARRPTRRREAGR